VITAAAILATAVRFHDQGNPVHNVLGSMDYRAIMFGFVLIISMAAMGLYQTRLREGFSGQLVRLMVAFLLGSLILATLYYAIPGLYLGRGVTALAFLFSLLGIAIVRPAFFQLVDLDSLKPRVLVLVRGEKPVGCWNA